MTTEADPRLVSLDADGSTHHVIVWNERYSHYLTRLVEAHEAWVRTQPDFETAVRAFATIAWDFVIEQLCPENSIVRRAKDSALARRVLGHTFAYRAETRDEDKQILDTLLDSPEMTDPNVRQLLRITIQCCRDLALEHEAHHYLRRYAPQWDARSPVHLAEMESRVLDLLSPFDRWVTLGGVPPNRTWSFFETVLKELPLSFLREEFEGTKPGEEIQSDLVPLLFLCNEGKKNVLTGCNEMEEFKSIAICYQAGRAWQIASTFLSGLRIEVARALGRNVRLPGFQDSDLGLRLMLGNLMCYKVLTDPPYADRSPTVVIDDPFMKQIEQTRTIAEVLTKIHGGKSHEVNQKHRALFLDDFERSNHHWLQVLNAVAIEIADRLQASADSSAGPAQPPKLEHYLQFLGIFSASRTSAG